MDRYSDFSVEFFSLFAYMNKRDVGIITALRSIFLSQEVCLGVTDVKYCSRTGDLDFLIQSRYDSDNVGRMLVQVASEKGWKAALYVNEVMAEHSSLRSYRVTVKDLDHVPKPTKREEIASGSFIQGLVMPVF